MIVDPRALTNPQGFAIGEPDPSAPIAVFRTSTTELDRLRWVFLAVGVVLGYALAKGR